MGKLLLFSLLVGISVGCYSGVKIFNAHHYNLCDSAKKVRVVIAVLIGLMAMITVLYLVTAIKVWMIGKDGGNVIGVGCLGLLVLGGLLAKCVSIDEEYDSRYDPHYRNYR